MTADENPSSLAAAGLVANSADNFNARSGFFCRCPHQRMTRTLGASAQSYASFSWLGCVRSDVSIIFLLLDQFPNVKFAWSWLAGA